MHKAAVLENCKPSFSSTKRLADVREKIASESSYFSLETDSVSILFNNLLKNFNA
jgi:hypothetical protein